MIRVRPGGSRMRLAAAVACALVLEAGGPATADTNVRVHPRWASLAPRSILVAPLRVEAAELQFGATTRSLDSLAALYAQQASAWLDTRLDRLGYAAEAISEAGVRGQGERSLAWTELAAARSRVAARLWGPGPSTNWASPLPVTLWPEAGALADGRDALLFVELVIVEKSEGLRGRDAAVTVLLALGGMISRHPVAAIALQAMLFQAVTGDLLWANSTGWTLYGRLESVDPYLDHLFESLPAVPETVPAVHAAGNVDGAGSGAQEQGSVAAESSASP